MDENDNDMETRMKYVSTHTFFSYSIRKIRY